MGQDICIRKDEKPLGYDWECGHEELYVRVNMYYKPKKRLHTCFRPVEIMCLF